jgi:DNA-binding HxlR family transcriptional regulator
VPPLPGRPCSAAAALHLVGEKWALLAVREILYGNRRFDAIARNTGAPRDILATRLRRLVDAGVLTKRVYSERPQRFEYRPTQAGLELEPVLLTLMAWGDRHLREDDNRPMVLEHSCGHEMQPVVVCSACGGTVVHEDLTSHPQAPGWTVTGPTAA